MAINTQPSNESAARHPNFLNARHLLHIDAPAAQLTRFLVPYAAGLSYYRVHQFDQALDTNFWTATATAGATAFAAGLNVMGGDIRGQTSATANRFTSLKGLAIFQGQYNPWMEVCWQVDVITNLQFEMGFADVITSLTVATTSDVDVPTIGNGTGDMVSVTMDTGQTLTTMAMVSKGSNAGGGSFKTNLGTLTPTASTLMRVRVGLSSVGTNVAAPFACIDNSAQQFYAHGNVAAERVASNVGLLPFLQFQNLSAANKIVDIHYIAFGMDRPG